MCLLRLRLLLLLLLRPVRVVPQLDLVLLSQPDLQHLGALPYLVGKKVGLKAPVYAATPIARLGPILYHDYYASLQVHGSWGVWEGARMCVRVDLARLVNHQKNCSCCGVAHCGPVC